MLFYSTRTLKRKKEGEAPKKKIPQIFHHKDLLPKSAKINIFPKTNSIFCRPMKILPEQEDRTEKNLKK